MKKTQRIIAVLKKPSFILSLLLFGFFLKEVFLVTLLPMFKGQDEARHYNTIQYLAEPKEKTWNIQEKPMEDREKEQLDTYNFSQEIKETIKSAGSNEFRDERYNKFPYQEGYNGQNEEAINKNLAKPLNEMSPPDVVKGMNSYHYLGALFEKFFQDESILVRFFLVRIFSALLGVVAILLSYLIIKNIGVSTKISLLLTAIMAFQPKLSAYFSNINYDTLLIPVFSLFLLGGILSLKNNINWKNFGLMLFAIIIGIFTKGTSIVLIVIFIALVGFFVYKEIANKKLAAGIFLLLLFATVSVVKLNYDFMGILPHNSNMNIRQLTSSVTAYLSRSLSRIPSSSKSYWGNTDWVSNDYSARFMYLIWTGELLAGIGLVIFFYSNNPPEFLPEKKYILFLLLVLISLQIGIRFYDWRTFFQSGVMELGTPGRYFLPALPAHIILIFTGLGTLLRKKEYFETALLAGLVLMFTFSMHFIFNIMIPRFYL